MKKLFPTTLGIFPSVTEQTYAMQIVCGSRPFLWNADTMRPMGGSLAAVNGGQDLGVASSTFMSLLSSQASHSKEMMMTVLTLVLLLSKLTAIFILMGWWANEVTRAEVGL